MHLFNAFAMNTNSLYWGLFMVKGMMCGCLRRDGRGKGGPFEGFPFRGSIITVLAHNNYRSISRTMYNVIYK